MPYVGMLRDSSESFDVDVRLVQMSQRNKVRNSVALFAGNGQSHFDVLQVMLMRKREQERKIDVVLFGLFSIKTKAVQV